MKLATAAATLALATSVSGLALNGWKPDATKFCYGLPGSLAPVGEFDPLGLAKNENLLTIKKYREAELQHGRVAMLATLGMLVTEEPIEFHPLFKAATKDIGPAIRHLDEVRAVEPLFFEYLAVFIGSLELNRALQGWKAPSETQRFQDLNDEYYPGDIGFDPLGLKPEEPEKFAEIQTKELQNGRLAMLGMAGMVAQELVNGKEIFVNLGWATDRFDPSVLPVQF
jgi:Chlorophyll A-B binding protein